MCVDIEDIDHDAGRALSSLKVKQAGVINVEEHAGGGGSHGIHFLLRQLTRFTFEVWWTANMHY